MVKGLLTHGDRQEMGFPAMPFPPPHPGPGAHHENAQSQASTCRPEPLLATDFSDSRLLAGREI